MTVSFRTRAIDSWCYTSNLVTTTIMGRCFLAFILAAPAVSAAFTVYGTVPGSGMEPTMAMAEVFWPTIAGFYLVFAGAWMFGLLLGALLSSLSSVVVPKTTITIDSRFCYRKDVFRHKVSWPAFAAVTEAANHYFFTERLRGFCIPKSAFASRAEADAFFQTALAYWREAKGLPPPPVPDTAGVWPPAPLPGNSVEPDDTPQC